MAPAKLWRDLLWWQFEMFTVYFEVTLFDREDVERRSPVVRFPVPGDATLPLASEEPVIVVRGVAEPGRALVMEVDDGPVGCIGPAEPPWPLGDRWRRRWHQLA